MFRARMFAICCGYEDADDLDHLRSDPAFKLACGWLPDTGRDLCSQPTLSRLENAPRLRDVIRLTYTLVDAWMDSYPREPASVTLDIDDTCDVVHGHQQLSLFNAHYDERCFLPIHVYDTEKSRPWRSSCGPARRRAASRCAPINEEGSIPCGQASLRSLTGWTPSHFDCRPAFSHGLLEYRTSPSRALPKFESHGMLETAAACGWKAKAAN
jgi:hypothetical protein